jgi:TRAP-type C4-dicarboxylate transport system substrate-binding protein
MTKMIRWIALTLLTLTPLAARAEPITVKLSFYTSDRSSIYQNSIKPFVDAVNRDGKGLIEIKVEFSSAITRLHAQMPQLVADGKIEMAHIVPGLSPTKFGDTAVMELPGLYRDSREAGLVFIRLIQRGVLKGYEDFFVVGGFVSEPENIHSRKPIASINDLKGLTIRTNNQIEADVLKKLGAMPQLIAINKTTDAVSSGKVDGATFPPSMLFEFGVGRVTKYHYMIQLGGAPTVLVMNRKKFESLSTKAQAIIRKYSGQWLVDQSATSMEALDKKVLAELEADPRRKVVFPSPSDLASARGVFASVTEEWVAQNPHNRELLELVRAEIAKLRSSKEIRH